MREREKVREGEVIILRNDETELGETEAGARERTSRQEKGG